MLFSANPPQSAASCAGSRTDTAENRGIPDSARVFAGSGPGIVIKILRFGRFPYDKFRKAAALGVNAEEKVNTRKELFLLKKAPIVHKSVGALFACFGAYIDGAEVRAQSSPESSNRARQLDGLLQDYAYRAFDNPKTGRPYEAPIPANLSGIRLTTMRLVWGSLRKRGVPRYNEFEIPSGLIAKPYVKRLALVYQNLGNWSSFYYSSQGFRFLAPVLGLLAYDATDLSAKGLRELDVAMTRGSILIHFTNVSDASSNATPQCVYFDLHGFPKFSKLESNNVCSTRNQGHFSIVVESNAPVPPPTVPPSPAMPPPAAPPAQEKKEKKAWKIAVPVVAGVGVLVLFALLLFWLTKYRQRKKMAEMERQADIGEALQMTSVGNTRAPVAMGTRTPPSLENEYVP
ncbi:hypothetical protein ACLOJK_012294 [Asimina triloba]